MEPGNCGERLAATGPATGPVEWGGLEEFYPLLRAFLRRRCRDDNEAEDLLQETLLKAARFQAGVRDRTRLRPWMLQVASNVLRDHIRKVSRGARIQLDQDALATAASAEPVPGEPGSQYAFELGSELVDGDVLLSSLNSVYGHLRDRDRQVLASFYAGGQDAARTACECGIERQLVKVHLFRARKRLGRALLAEIRERRNRRLTVGP